MVSIGAKAATGSEPGQSGVRPAECLKKYPGFAKCAVSSTGLLNDSDQAVEIVIKTKPREQKAPRVYQNDNTAATCQVTPTLSVLSGKRQQAEMSPQSHHTYKPAENKMITLILQDSSVLDNFWK